MKALNRQEVPYAPIWIMRQAGRYLPEYREIRKNYSFFEMCRTPEVAAEITLQPIRRFELDAAILFSDILVPLPPMGIDVEFVKGKGPQINNPIRNYKDIEKVKTINSEKDVSFVGDAIKIIINKLNSERALIGFSGAPFTLASYSVEEGSSKNYKNIKKLMWEQGDAFKAFMDKITDVVIDYLSFQIKSGVDVVQLFDSWVGILSPRDFRSFVLPYLKKIVRELKPSGIPIIYFGTMTAGLFGDIRQLDVDAVGVDWRIDIDRAWDLIGKEKSVQGNLDPMILYSGKEAIEKAAEDILIRTGRKKGHIFNLGHGITPGVPVESVEFLVNFVHNRSGELRE